MKTAPAEDWQAGDILAFHGTDWQAWVIRNATRWPFDPCSLLRPPTHVGIITQTGFDDEPVMVEATTLCQHDCLIAKRPVSGAQVQRIPLRINDYLHAGGRVDHYRLVGVHQLTQDEQLNLHTLLICDIVSISKATYDMRGALLSGAKLPMLLHWLPTADLNQLFCSELIAAALMRICVLNQSNPAWYNPGRLIRELLRLGKYQRLRTITDGEVDEEMIIPFERFRE